jgi:hypothetical protein
MSLDVTLACLKGKDAESEKRRNMRTAVAWAVCVVERDRSSLRGGPWVADQDIDPVGLV